MRSAWFRAAVSAGLLAAVLTRIDFGAAGDRLSGGRWALFAAAVVAVFASFIVGALRWHVYLEAAGVASGRRHTIRSYLIGAFTNNFLPTEAGGDVTRVWVATRPGTRMRAAAAVLVCLVAVGWLACVADPAAVPGQLVAALGATMGAIAAAGLLAALAARSGWLARRAPARSRAH